MLTSPDTARAFDLSKESDACRDRYGRNAWGQQCLLARRLVEAGVELIGVTLAGELCGRANNWDDHAVNQHVFDALKYRTPFMNQAITALIEEIHERSLDRRTLIVVGGGIASVPAGTMQPGRDHWPSAMSFVFSGGGITPGRVIGSTDIRGEQAVERRVGVQDFVVTLYHHLGIDANNISLQDFSGRPIPELIGSTV